MTTDTTSLPIATEPEQDDPEIDSLVQEIEHERSAFDIAMKYRMDELEEGIDDQAEELEALDEEMSQDLAVVMQGISTEDAALPGFAY
jgi:hypothetical protein